MPLNYNCRWLAVLLLCGFAYATAIFAQDGKPAVGDSVDKDYSADLPRTEPLSPDEAMKSFEIVPGFELEQVAAEPLVADPIAICFDENSRMYVIEMRGYSEERDQKLSRIKLLEDTDEDGKYDKATVFAEGLLWPTAIHCWKGGVFVADAPDLFYLKDTNGDGVADEKKVVLTGFGTSNVQGLVNTFQWSLDSRITMAISSSGAVLTNPHDPKSKPLTIRGRDVAFDPVTMELTPITGGAQHGATTDRWGNRFVCSNSDHIQHCVFEDRYLARNPYLAVSNARRSIAVDGPQADVFRISPLEPWRVIRTRLRVNKIVPGIVEGGGRAAGYFTGATGVTIYNGDAWPEEHLGLAFIGDVGSNLVHRKRLTPNGVSFKAERMDEKKEFLASRDTWFRPVQFANAPDGCLYICDMYRETIEHPASIPPVLKKHIDLTSGRDRGRIYRVVHEKSSLRKQLPKLGSAKSAELVAMLDHPNGWHRETAARLLYERQDAGVRAALASLVQKAKRPEGRIAALYVLLGMNSPPDDLLAARLQDEHAAVRRHALRVAELRSAQYRVHDQSLKMTTDPDIGVRFQAAFAISQFQSPERIPALAAILRKDLANADVRAAVQTSVPDFAGSLLTQVAKDEQLLSNPGGAELLRSLLTQIGKQQNDSDLALVGLLMERWAEQKSPLLPLAMQHLGLSEDSSAAKVIAAATKGKSAAILTELVQRAKATALDANANPAARVAAVQQLRFAKVDTSQEVAALLLSPAHPQEVQAAIIGTLSSYQNIVDPAKLLVQKYSELTPALKGLTLDALIANQFWCTELLAAIESGSIPAGEIDANRWKLLTEHPFGPTRQRAIKLAAANRPTDRSEVLTTYRPVLEATGDADRGKEVFKKNCSACHKLQGLGHELGPNLAAMKNRGPEAILVNVLDPNREVNPQFLNYLLLTTDGRSLSGMLVSETATSVTLRKQENATETVLRVEIEQLKSTGQSLMPVGLEKQIDKAAMADLLQYLKTVE